MFVPQLFHYYPSYEFEGINECLNIWGNHCILTHFTKEKGLGKEETFLSDFIADFGRQLSPTSSVGRALVGLVQPGLLQGSSLRSFWSWESPSSSPFPSPPPISPPSFSVCSIWLWKISNIQQSLKNFAVNTHISTIQLLPLTFLPHLLYQISTYIYFIRYLSTYPFFH